MTKSIMSISVDPDIIEAAKVKKFQDEEFNLSKIINDFLREYFSIDLEDLDRKKLDMEESEMKRKLALIQAQKSAIENENKRKIEEKNLKLYGDKNPKTIEVK